MTYTNEGFPATPTGTALPLTTRPKSDSLWETYQDHSRRLTLLECQTAQNVGQLGIQRSQIVACERYLHALEERVAEAAPPAWPRARPPSDLDRRLTAVRENWVRR